MSDSVIFKERIFPVIFMLILTVVFIGVVSAIYLSTRDLVLLNESLFLKKALLYAADIPIPEGSAETEAVYEKNIREVTEDNGTPLYYELTDEGGNIGGYAIVAAGPGLWGEIQAVLAFEKDLETLKGLEFIKQNETPGLGARISEEWFKEQFRGKKGPFVMVPEGEASAANEIDAITGATRTSVAVRSILNNAAENAGEIVKGGN